MSSLDSREQWEEIMGKDLILLKVREGDGNTAEMGTVVKCNLRGYFREADKTQSEPFEVWNSQQFKVGENDAIPGIEMAVRFSKVGSLFRVRFKSKFGYGSTGRPAVQVEDHKDGNEKSLSPNKFVSAIPPDMDLEYEIDVTEHLKEGQIDPDLLKKHPIPSKEIIGELNGDAEQKSVRQLHDERLSALTELLQRKDAGNRWFSYGDFSRAARAYSKATQVADRYFNGTASNGGDTSAQALQELAEKKSGNNDTATDGTSLAEANEALAAAEQKKEAQRRRFEQGDEEVVSGYISCLNNMAAAQLRMGENSKAKDICVRVLEMDPNNHKALLRAAKAALATHDHEECSLCLEKLLAIAPAGSSAALAAAAEKKRLRQAQSDYREQQKKMSNNMARQLARNPRSASHSIASTAHRAEGEKDCSVVEGQQQARNNTVTAPPLSSAVNSNTSTTAATATSSGAADRGLLLLLCTSLAVLFVSVAMMLWGPSSSTYSSMPKHA